jgi:hypothetical protein
MENAQPLWLAFSPQHHSYLMQKMIDIYCLSAYYPNFLKMIFKIKL